MHLLHLLFIRGCAVRDGLSFLKQCRHLYSMRSKLTYVICQMSYVMSLQHACIRLPYTKLQYTKNNNVLSLCFADMKFATASRMRPRWLVLAMMVGEDALFLHYKVPTIVMSRSCDQNNKVHSASSPITSCCATFVSHGLPPTLLLLASSSSVRCILKSCSTVAINKVPSSSSLLTSCCGTFVSHGLSPTLLLLASISCVCGIPKSCLAVVIRRTRSVPLLLSLLAAVLHACHMVFLHLFCCRRPFHMCVARHSHALQLHTEQEGLFLFLFPSSLLHACCTTRYL